MRVVCFHLNQIGDLLFSLPALKSIRDSSPGVSITSVVRPGATEVMESTGLADRVLARPSGVNLSKLHLARHLASERYDLALVFSQSAECALLSYLARAPRRVGFVNTSLGRLLTQRVEFDHPPSTQNNLRLVAAAGYATSVRSYSGLLKPTAEQVARAEELLGAHGIGPADSLVAISPGTSGRRSVKEWTDTGFAAVGKHLTGSGMKVVVLGTRPAPEIVRDCPEIIDLSGKTTLGEAAAILARAGALVAVDSGILHLGAAAGTKVVGLYGPSNPEITGPQGQGHVVLTSGAECSPCVRTECEYDRKCMTNLDPAEVLAAVDRILDQEGTS